LARRDAIWLRDLAYCFGGGTPPAAGGGPPAAPDVGPRGSFRLAMQFFKNLVRSAPCSFWSSAPNLQVAIFSFAVTANDGAIGSTAMSAAVKKRVREAWLSMAFSPDCRSV
jgi:hypothetical protein